MFYSWNVELGNRLDTEVNKARTAEMQKISFEFCDSELDPVLLRSFFIVVVDVEQSEQVVEDEVGVFRSATGTRIQFCLLASRNSDLKGDI